MFGLYAMDGAERAVPRRSCCTAWCATSAARRCRSRVGNVVDPLDWMDTYGADAVRFTLARGANPGADVADRRGLGPGLPQLLQQDLERHPLRADERRHGRRRAADAELHGRRPLDPVAAERGRSPRSTRSTRTTSSPRSPTRCTTSPGTRSSTGTSSWPRRRSGGAARRPTRRGACSARCSTSLLRLLHPIDAVRHRGAVDGAHRRRVRGHRRLAGADRSPGRGRRARRSLAVQASSPRSAGSGPTRACSPARRCRRHSSLSAAPGRARRADRIAAAPAAAAAEAAPDGWATPATPAACTSGSTCPARSTSAAERARLEQGPRGRPEGGGAGERQARQRGFLAKAPDAVVDKIRAAAGGCAAGQIARLQRPAATRCRQR